jgi:hypothetical protein
MKYIDVCINTRVFRCTYYLKKNLYMILNNMYIWFEEYGIEYVCMKYIQFEKYDASTRMNDDG